MKRNFLLRKTFSKDNILSERLSERKDYPSKSSSPVKKKQPLYEKPLFESSPIFEKPIIKRDLIRI